MNIVEKIEYIGEGDIIQFYTSSLLKVKKHTAKVEYKSEFGHYCIVNNKIYPISKLFDIVVIKSNNSVNYFENTVVTSHLPQRWDQLENLQGFFITEDSYVTDRLHLKNKSSKYYNKNIFTQKELATASLALSQLSQLRDIYRHGWKPNWMDIDEPKFVIKVTMNEAETDVHFTANQFLSFQSYEVRDEFFRNFKELIIEASPLLFG